MKTFSFCPPRFQGWRLLSFFNIVAYPSSDALSWDMSSQKLAVATSLSTVSRLLNHWNIFALNCLLPDGGDDSWLRVFWQFNLWKILIQFNEFNKFFDSSATSKAKIFRWNWKYLHYWRRSHLFHALGRFLLTTATHSFEPAPQKSTWHKLTSLKICRTVSFWV